jgi:hypothetical protein
MKQYLISESSLYFNSCLKIPNSSNYIDISLISSPFLLTSLSSKPTRELDVLTLYSHPFGMDRTQICIFKKRDKISFNGLLQGTDGRRLKSYVVHIVLRDFSHKPLEGEFPDQ